MTPQTIFWMNLALGLIVTGVAVGAAIALVDWWQDRDDYRWRDQ